MKSKSLW